MKRNDFSGIGLIWPLLQSLALPALLCFASGCTTTLNVDVKPRELQAVQKSPVKVALVMDKVFTEYKHEMNDHMGDINVTPLGSALQSYAKNIAKNNFKTVLVVASVTEAAGQANAVLIPKVVKFDESWGVGFGTKHNMVIVIEWNLKDRSCQKDLWLDTVDGRAEGAMPSAFFIHSAQQTLVQSLFDDLSFKTQKEFEESAEIKKLVGSSSP